MFGDLFEEDFSFISNNHCGKGKKSKPRDSEPPAPRDFTNLSGIKNQGGTCYLNSLLQTLLFTPEFRVTEALFSLGPGELGTLDVSSKPDAKSSWADTSFWHQGAGERREDQAHQKAKESQKPWSPARRQQCHVLQRHSQ